MFENMYITMVISVWHTGHPEDRSATRSAHVSQNRAWPHGTEA